MSTKKFDNKWLDQRIKDRADAKRRKVLTPPGGWTVQIDGGTFSVQLAELAVTMTNRIERDGCSVIGSHDICFCFILILRQLTETYNLTADIRMW